MKRLLLIAIGIIAIVATATAQPSLQLIDSLLLHTDAPHNVDRPFTRAFGFSSGYTDSIDYRLSSNREREVPTFPPSTFSAYFVAQNTPALIDRDIRGVPDSVRAGTPRFSLRFILEIQRAQGQVVTLVMPRALPRGIDSINIRDIIGGTGGFVFSETITEGPDSVTIPNNGLTQIAIIAYYDEYDLTGSINEPVAATPSLRLLPNPAVDRVAIDAALPAGARVVVTDMRGTVVRDERISERTEGLALTLADVGSGIYFVRAFAENGLVIASNRLVIGR